MIVLMIGHLLFVNRFDIFICHIRKENKRRALHTLLIKRHKDEIFAQNFWYEWNVINSIATFIHFDWNEPAILAAFNFDIQVAPACLSSINGEQGFLTNKYFLGEVHKDFVAVVNQAWKWAAIDVFAAVRNCNSPFA